MKSCGCASESSADYKKKGSCGESIPDVLQSVSSSKSSQFSGSAEEHNFKYVVLNIVKDHHLWPWCHPPLFHKFKWFTLKAALAYHPCIQKELDKLIAKGAIEMYTGSTGFYSCLCGT